MWNSREKVWNNDGRTRRKGNDAWKTNERRYILASRIRINNLRKWILMLLGRTKIRITKTAIVLTITRTTATTTLTKRTIVLVIASDPATISCSTNNGYPD